MGGASSVMSLSTVGMSLLLSAGAAVAQIPGIVAPGGGVGEKQDKNATRHTTVRLISEHTGMKPGGTVMLGIHVVIEPGWHTYWNGRNDSGTPLTAEWELPAGWTVGEWQWPTPVRHVGEGDILDHIYEKEVTLLVPLKAPETAKAGDKVTVKAKAEWLVCREACVFEDGAIETTLTVVDPKTEPATTAEAVLIAAARERVPSTDGRDRVKTEWGVDTVTITAEGAGKIEFFPAADCIGLVDPVRRTSIAGPTLRLKVDASEPQRQRLRGILSVTRNGKLERGVRLDVAPGDAGKQSPAPASGRPKQEGGGGN